MSRPLGLRYNGTMPNWRRAHVRGGSFIFTVVTDRRSRFLTDLPARPVLDFNDIEVTVGE